MTPREGSACTDYEPQRKAQAKLESGSQLVVHAAEGERAYRQVQQYPYLVLSHGVPWLL